MAEYRHPEPLVSIEWVAEHRGDANVRLVEVDVDTSAYEQGHIAGSVGWNGQSQLQQSVRPDVISKEEMEQLLGSAHREAVDIGSVPGRWVVNFKCLSDTRRWRRDPGFWRRLKSSMRRPSTDANAVWALT